jgi:hypothetical protein
MRVEDWKRPRGPNAAKAVWLGRGEGGRWQFGIQFGRSSTLVQATLIGPDLSPEEAQKRVIDELTMTLGVGLIGTWGTLSNREGWWRATLWLIPQPD